MNKEILLNPPAVESFLDSACLNNLWPENLVANEVFLEQIKMRNGLNDQLDSILNCLPQPYISLESAVNQGHIIEDQVASFYASLSDLLESDHDYKRIILYLPFEFLPDKNWYFSSEKNRKAKERFSRVYMETWQSLLSICDVRANFVDGDVLEVEQRVGDLPRVVKAVHLIPKLVEKGLITIKDVVSLAQESDDEIFKNSISDILPILAGAMRQSSAREQQTKVKPKTMTFSFIQDNLRKEFSRIDAKDYGGITEKRKIWLKQRFKREIIDFWGEDISQEIIVDNFPENLTASFFVSGADTASLQVLIGGIRKAIESIASADLSKARALYGKRKDGLLKLWDKNDLGIKEELLKTFRRLHHLGLVDVKQLKDLGIVIPKLAGPFLDNLKLAKKEVSAIRNAIASIEADSELSRLIYPIIFIYGSRLKGYSEQGADIDLGVFVRPNISFDCRIKLRDLIRKNFLREKVKGETIEFWLEEKDDFLIVRDFSEADSLLGKRHWTHILFGAAWLGNRDSIRGLYEKLLVPYMYDTDEMIHGHEARSLYLEEMERDMLLYRLMHKGYECFFPPCGKINTKYVSIDGKSAFWDSGYRQLATRLFLSRVFLPKINISH